MKRAFDLGRFFGDIGWALGLGVAAQGRALEQANRIIAAREG